MVAVTFKPGKQPPPGQRLFKSSVSTAKRLVMRSRKPIAQIIDEQQAKHAKLEARIGQLMSQRVDLEEVLAELYELQGIARRPLK